MRLKAYKNASIYIERIKRWYDKRLKKKEFKEGDKVFLYNSRFKTFGKGKLQSKWDRPYVVHSVLSNGAVTIMDVKGDQFMVNGQRLKVYYEPDVVPPNVRPRTKNKASIFVNSFSFNFLEFLTKIYWANFFPWAKEAKKRAVHEKTGPARPPRQGWPVGPVRPAQVGPGGSWSRFLPELLLFDFLLW
jgi:hypothetical protein